MPFRMCPVCPGCLKRQSRSYENGCGFVLIVSHDLSLPENIWLSELCLLVGRMLSAAPPLDQIVYLLSPRDFSSFAVESADSQHSTSSVKANFPRRPAISNTLTGTVPRRTACRKACCDGNPSAFVKCFPEIRGPNSARSSPRVPWVVC